MLRPPLTMGQDGLGGAGAGGGPDGAVAGLAWQTVDFSDGSDIAAVSYSDANSSYSAETFNFETGTSLGRPIGTTGGRVKLLGAGFDYSGSLGLLARLQWADFKGYWNGSGWTAGVSPNTDVGMVVGLTNAATTAAGWWASFSGTNTTQYVRAGRFGSAGNYQLSTTTPPTASPFYAWFPFGTTGPRFSLGMINQGHATLQRHRAPDGEAANVAHTDLYISVLADVVYNHSTSRQRWEGCRLEYALVPVPA